MMNISKLIKGLSYLGEVESKKQTYYVLQNPKQYWLLSFSSEQKGHFNIVNSAAVDYVYNKVKCKSNITAKDILALSRKPNYVSSNFDALNITYVLLALGKAKIDTRFKDKSLHFNFR